MSLRIFAGLLLCVTLLGACTSYAKLINHDPDVGEQEVYAAGVDGDSEEIVPHLIYVLRHRAEFADEVVVAALASLAEAPDARTLDAVAALARDSDEEVRWHVALALKAIGGELAQTTLASMAEHDASEMVRAEASS